MKVGGIYYKIAPENRLTSFSNHLFDIMLVNGVKPSPDKKTTIICSLGKFKTSEVDRISNKGDSTLFVGKDYSLFLSLSDALKNETLRDIGWYNSLVELETEYNNRLRNKIIAERSRLQAELTRLDDLENDL